MFILRISSVYIKRLYHSRQSKATMQLPEAFEKSIRPLIGEDRWKKYIAAFDQQTPTSIRLNPWKAKEKTLGSMLEGAEQVPWCKGAYYLKQRPDFTMDPLLHAGAYYVQEASSLFLAHVIANLYGIDGKALPVGTLPLPTTALDLCAAPGGKSTLLRAMLPESTYLYANEPDRKRANILMENLQKQGHDKVTVTNNFPSAYAASGLTFDLVLTDVPCSGEGMFRKDPDTIGEWSTENVGKCAELQRSIIDDIWRCLNPGGVLIYSTCTFNIHEDEDNIEWIVKTKHAEPIDIPIEPEWNITGSLSQTFKGPVFRFIPGITRGEGIFMAVLRKPVGEQSPSSTVSDVPSHKDKRNGKRQNLLRVLSDSTPVPTMKGKTEIPSQQEALMITTPKDKYPRAEVDRQTALRYLHHEAVVLAPDTPKGIVLVTYQGLPLGFAKNIGNRANNLYPQEWKIRKDV